jgi:hypothetical protein
MYYVCIMLSSQCVPYHRPVQVQLNVRFSPNVIVQQIQIRPQSHSCLYRSIPSRPRELEVLFLRSLFHLAMVGTLAGMSIKLSVV